MSIYDEDDPTVVLLQNDDASRSLDLLFSSDSDFVKFNIDTSALFSIQLNDHYFTLTSGNLIGSYNAVANLNNTNSEQFNLGAAINISETDNTNAGTIEFESSSDRFRFFIGSSSGLNFYSNIISPRVILRTNYFKSFKTIIFFLKLYIFSTIW